MKKWYKLSDIADFNNINNYFKATGTPTIQTGLAAVDLWSEDDFEAIFEGQSEKSIYMTESDSPWAGFKNKYTQWLNRNKSFIANEAYSLLLKFNPLVNFKKHEEHSGSDTATKTPTEWIQTKTETPDDWKRTETQTPTNWQKENVKSFTNYHETETETPENWEKTRTETPTNWQKTIDHSVSVGYSETDTQTPTNWKKTTETEGTPETNNARTTTDSVIPFNGSDFSNTNKTISVETKKVAETQSGTLANVHTQTGTKTDTEEQTGTYQVTEEQAGTYERDRTKTGTETDTETQSGTYKVEIEETGSKTETIEQTGTMEDVTEFGHEIDTEGYNGVSATELIKEVIALYDCDFVKRWIMKFFNEYCYYV